MPGPVAQHIKAMGGRPSRPSFNSYGASGWYSSRDRFDYAREAGDLRLNSVISIGTGWLKRQVPQAQLAVGTRDAQGKYQPDATHQFLAIWKRPNPFFSLRATLAGTIDSYAIDGFAYWLKARDGFGQFREFYWVPNHQMTPKLGKSRPVEGWWYDNGRERRWYDTWDVVHFRHGVNPSKPWQGMSDLTAQLGNVVGLNAAVRYTSSILRKAHAGKVLVPKEAVGQVISGTPEEQEMLALASKLERDTSGEEAGSLTYTSLPVELINSGLGPEEMGLDRIADRPEALVVAALNLNTLVLNLPSSDSTRTYSNKAEARREAWEDGVIPLQDELAEDGIEAQLLYRSDELGNTTPEFDGDSQVYAWWDRADVPALREDENERVNRATSLWGSGLGRRDECRAILGWPPLGGELGEQILGAAPEPSTTDPQSNGPQNNDQPPDGEDGNTNDPEAA